VNPTRTCRIRIKNRMNIREFLLGTGQFKTTNEVIKLISTSPKYGSAQQGFSDANALLIFQASKQQTWLVATRSRLYCVLDDVERNFTRIQWRISKEQLIADKTFTLSIITHDNTERIGTVDIGERKGWLYSKKLFASEPITESIKRLIRSRMLPEINC
jgi:hypothetical protein